MTVYPTIVTMTLRRRIVFGLVLLLSLQAVEAGAIVHAMDKVKALKACASAEQVISITADIAQNSIDTHDFGDDCCNFHFHSSLTAINGVNLTFIPASNKYTEKLPAEYVVDIATLLKPPKTV